MGLITVSDRYHLTSPILEARSPAACSRLIWLLRVPTNLTLALLRRPPDHRGVPVVSARLLTSSSSILCLLSVEVDCRLSLSGRLCPGHNHLTPLRRRLCLPQATRPPQLPYRHP